MKQLMSQQPIELRALVRHHFGRHDDGGGARVGRVGFFLARGPDEANDGRFVVGFEQVARLMGVRNILRGRVLKAAPTAERAARTCVRAELDAPGASMARRARNDE
jgi:hypothetical protein